MNVLEHLATSLGRRDELPNQELAEKIAATEDRQAISTLVALLAHKSKDVQHDAIKVLYEIGERQPGLIHAYTPDFLALLLSKNNRIQWGAMAALDGITKGFPETIYSHLPEIVEAMNLGSVITRDRGVSILVELMRQPKFQADATTLMLEQLHTALPNQLPMYAEMALPTIPASSRAAFHKAISARLEDMEKESKRKRLEKVLKHLGQTNN